MISYLLLYKILQLFIIMILGYLLVKAKVVTSKDSIVLSKLSLYLFMPAVIINSFNIEITDKVIKGLALSFATAVFIHIVLVIADNILKKFFNATCVERASIMYSNAGNLIVPIVSFVLGEEWVLYSCPFLIVQLVFLWTHGVGLFSDEKISVRKILLNVNMIAVIVGFIIMLSPIKLPDFAGDIVSSLGGMLAPAGMIIAGMLAAEIDFGKMLKNKRLYLVFAARLIVCPVIVMLLLKGALSVIRFDNAHTIMLISYLASITPSASTIMQFSQIYGKDADYATVINAVTTVGCIVTMPLLLLFF